jgi:hypothetical protein
VQEALPPHRPSALTSENTPSPSAMTKAPRTAMVLSHSYGRLMPPLLQRQDPVHEGMSRGDVDVVLSAAA